MLAPPNIPTLDYLYVTLNSSVNSLEVIEYNNINTAFTINVNISVPNDINDTVLRVNNESIASQMDICELILNNGKSYDLTSENFCKIDNSGISTVTLNCQFISIPQNLKLKPQQIFLPGFEMNFEHVDGQESITNPINIQMGNNLNIPAPPNAPEINGSEYLHVSLIPQHNEIPLVSYNTIDASFSATVDIIPNGTGIVGDQGHVNVIVNSQNIALQTSICKLTLSDNWEGLEYDLRTEDVHEIPFYAGLGIRLDVSFIFGFEMKFYLNNKENILGPLNIYNNYGNNIPAPPNIPIPTELYVSLIEPESGAQYIRASIENVSKFTLNIDVPLGNNDDLIILVDKDRLLRVTSICTLTFRNNVKYDLRNDNQHVIPSDLISNATLQIVFV